MQTPTQSQPVIVPNQAPAPPVSIATVGPDGKPQTLTIPRSAAEVRELLAQRQELGEQLSSVASRRRTLAEEIRTTHNDAIRTGLENRLALLDQRILQIETDLAMAGRQLSAAPAELVAYTETRSQGDDGFEAGMMIGGFSALFAAIVLFFARRRWKRTRPALPAQMGADSANRLERLEQGMDAIAVEIERISEGQRFVTKLLSESQSPFAGSQRIAQPEAVEQGDPARQRR